MTTALPPYDERRLQAELESYPRARRVAFGCAVAECLFSLYVVYVEAAGEGDPNALRSALDVGWTLAASNSVSTFDVEAAQTASEQLVPDDDDATWMLLSPLAQNAAAAVAYALRTWLADDPQEAVWAARQLHEAADYLVQLVGADHSYTQDSSDEPMPIASQAIESALARARSAPISDLKAGSQHDGSKLRRLLGSVS